MLCSLFYRELFQNLIIILCILGIYCSKIPTPNNIIDGEDADKYSFPFIVSINGSFEGPSSSGVTYGAGVLVTKQYILTVKQVAFMMEGTEAKHDKLVTVFPNYNLNLRDPIYASRSPLRVEKKMCMTKNTTPYSNELVVLKLKDEIPAEIFTTAINISQKLPSAILRFKTAGWGMSQRGNFSSKRGILQKAEVTVKNTCTPQCPLIWEVEDTGDAVAACYGDEGGPVVTKKDPPLLVGLLLGPKKDCSETSVLNIVARKDWIEKIIKGETEDFTDCLSEKKVGVRKEDSSKDKKKGKEEGGDKKEKKSKSKDKASLKLEINLKNNNP